MISPYVLAQARATDIMAVAEGLGAQLHRVGAAEWAGPCPRCGGTDRFGVNTRIGDVLDQQAEAAQARPATEPVPARGADLAPSGQPAGSTPIRVVQAARRLPALEA